MALFRKYFIPGTIVALLLGAVFALLGVYDTDEVPFGQRYIFWTSTMITGSIATAFVAPWVFNKALKDHHVILRLLAIAALISIPVTIVLALWNSGFTRPWTLTLWVLQYIFVIIISIITTFGGYAILKAIGWIDPAPEGLGMPSPMEKFMERLPVNYRAATLYAVSSEDHYLRIHTDRGEELILMRLSDALRELETAKGVQTHRSWWVAEEGVAEIGRANGKQVLTLKSGVTVPVSRTYAKAVQEAGFAGR